MKANEFVKKFGWEESKALVNAQSWTMRQIALSTTVDTNELTRLVESHELVAKFGDLPEERKYVDDKILPELSRAILDVESCQ